MLRLLSSALLLATLGLVFGPTARPAPTSRAAAPVVYTCPMHPEVTDTKPSRCPKCKMKLVPKQGSREYTGADLHLVRLR